MPDLMKTSFKTISAPSEGFYKEKGSKFFAFAYQVADEYQVKERLENLKKQYHDARHHCYAFVLFGEPESFRASDDGEPSNSAGQPILRQIRSFGLTNTLVIVVRYFGGTKLGVGGLVNAYGTAAEEALSQAVQKEVILYKNVTIKFAPQDIHQAMKVIQACEALVEKEDFVGSQSIYYLKVPLSNAQVLEESLITHYKVEASFDHIG